MASASTSAPGKADYGIDAPKTLRWLATRGALLALFGVIVFNVNQISNPQAAHTIGAMTFFPGIGFLAAAAVMFWSSKVGKLKLRDEMLDSITWNGSEKVLDAGCGRGLMLIGAAKKLGKGGRTTGCDLWTTDLSGNTLAAVSMNAKSEGVSDKTKIDTADIRKLPYAEASFDVVLSSFVIQNIRGPEGRELAVKELWRVLKPGGTLLIADIFQTPNYAKMLQERGANVTLSGTSFLWCLPTRWLRATK
jgi:SAM-dependent methyltransferase